MATYNNISAKVIIRKIMRDLKLSNDNWVDDAIEWIGEALEHIGASPQLEKKVCTLTVKEYTTCLPSDLYYINLVGVNNSISSGTNSELKLITTQIAAIKALLDADPTQEVNSELFKLNSRLAILEGMYWDSPEQIIPLAYSTSEFPKSLHCDKCANSSAVNKDTYFINGGKIKTSFITGTICLSYMAFPTDEECYPMVPDDISFKEAMFWYVYKKLLLGDPNSKPNGIDYAMAEGQWKYYCTQARMESFMNQWVRLIPNMNAHDSNFEDLNTREQLSRNL